MSGDFVGQMENLEKARNELARLQTSVDILCQTKFSSRKEINQAINDLFGKDHGKHGKTLCHDKTGFAGGNCSMTICRYVVAVTPLRSLL